MPISDVSLMDCMKFMGQFPDKFFHLAIVDPPYGINAPEMRMGTHETRKKGGYPGESTASKLRKGRLNQGSGKLKNRVLNTLDCNWDENQPSPEYFEELRRVSIDQIIWGGNYFGLPPTRGVICWDKLQPWENFSQWEMAWTSFDIPAAIFRYSNTGGTNKEKKIHPTQKPVELYRWLLNKFAKPGFKILDTHLGSGSSRLAAYALGFDFWACDLSPEYIDAQQVRFDKRFESPLFESGHNPDIQLTI